MTVLSFPTKPSQLLIRIYVFFTAALGSKIASEIKKELRHHVVHLKKQGVEPHLVVLLVGDRPDSAVYVSMKKKACTECGIKSTEIKFPINTTESEVLDIGNREVLHIYDRITEAIFQLVV